jgi:hypothetical protein
MDSIKETTLKIPCDLSNNEASMDMVSRKLRKKNYEKIDDDMRKKIIFEVTVLGNKLKTICEKLNINVSSAKNVLAIYKKEGRIEKKKYRVKRKKGFNGQEVVQDLANESTIKIPDIPSQAYFAPYSSNLTDAPSMISIQNYMGLNDLSLNLLLSNYCMCPAAPQIPTMYSLQSVEEYFKTQQLNLASSTAGLIKNYLQL